MEDVVVRPKPARVAAAGGRLCVNAGSHAIAKSPPPPAPKIRIIHLFAPEVIQTDAANFRALVQRLTGKQAIGSDADDDGVRMRRRSGKSKNKKAKPEPPPQHAPPPAAPLLSRQESSGVSGSTSTDSGRCGSEDAGPAPFGPPPAFARPVKEEGEVLEDLWFGGSYGSGNGGGGSSCSGGSDVGTDGAEFCGFVDLDELVQGFYDYPHDASMGCSTVYADLFGDSPVSGC